MTIASLATFVIVSFRFCARSGPYGEVYRLSDPYKQEFLNRPLLRTASSQMAENTIICDGSSLETLRRSGRNSGQLTGV
jgi:hypothetical protein